IGATSFANVAAGGAADCAEVSDAPVTRPQRDSVKPPIHRRCSAVMPTSRSSVAAARVPRSLGCLSKQEFHAKLHLSRWLRTEDASEIWGERNAVRDVEIHRIQKVVDLPSEFEPPVVSQIQVFLNRRVDR